MKKIIGTLLIVLAIYLGYTGISLFTDSGSSVEIVGIDISAHDNQERTTAFIYLGFAVVSFLSGIFLMRSSTK